MLTKPFKIKKQFPQILNSCGLWGRRQLRLRQRDWVLSVHGVSVRSSSEAIVAKWFCDSIQIRCCLCRPFQCSDYFFHITTGRARLWSQGPGRCERWGQAGPCGGGSGRSAPGSPASPRTSRGGAETTQPHFPGEKQTAGWGGNMRSPGRGVGWTQSWRAVAGSSTRGPCPPEASPLAGPFPAAVPAACSAVPGGAFGVPPASPVGLPTSFSAALRLPQKGGVGVTPRGLAIHTWSPGS